MKGFGWQEMEDVIIDVWISSSKPTMKRYRWVFPGKDGFEITKGEGVLREYHFGRRTMVHRGFRYHTPKGTDVGINVNTLQDIDQWSLTVHKYNGLDHEPQYNAPKHTGELPTSKFEDEKRYPGAYHCGAKKNASRSATAAYVAAPQGGTIICYPHQDQVSISGTANLTTYSFGQGYNLFKFCSACSVTVCIERDVYAVTRWPQTWNTWMSAQRERWPNILPLNLRCLQLEGEWDDVFVDVYKADMRGVDPRYVVPE
ncbi:hypothetical protein EYC80_001391 [Monilinia laxa]|uniref:CENP-V/GFA domain-containing protein n=1 Tax=Monilinia laxa TaxID=61186 RepID=A0A5N6K973_MONLA|nr:hypothetical protein EYC80_001391 [Monilinia laxa]